LKSSDEDVDEVRETMELLLVDSLFKLLITNNFSNLNIKVLYYKAITQMTMGKLSEILKKNQKNLESALLHPINW